MIYPRKDSFTVFTTPVLLCISLLTACGGSSDSTTANNIDTNNPIFNQEDLTTLSSLIDGSKQTQPVFSSTNSQEMASIQLDWAAPVIREDGSFLEASDIAGYTIKIGTTPNNYERSFFLSNPEQTQIIMDGIPDNTYYIAIQTLDTEGLISTASDPIKVTVAAVSGG